MISGVTPAAQSPIAMCLTSADFPSPGRASTEHDGLEIRLASRNQEIGSKHTAPQLSGWCPIGTPTEGFPVPTTNG